MGVGGWVECIKTGVKEDDIVQTIFNKFYTTKSKKSGSGLGLSIVKNVLKEHKADINIESSESLTKFIITFELWQNLNML